MSSSSFWSSLRYRVGGTQGMENRLNDLIRKQIEANSDANEVTIEEILHPIITLPSKMVMRDHLFQARVRSIAVGQNTLLPMDPDLEKLRLHIRNDHGGRYLTDHSLMKNKIQLNGTDQQKLIFANDDDGISGDKIVNRLIDDQYIRVEDNPNVRITNIVATEEGFSIFLRIYPEYAKNELLRGKPNVLFSKIDSEQVDYAYAGYMEDDGALQFYVRDADREYYLRAPEGTVVWVNINLPDYSATDYSTADYNTIGNIPQIPNPAPYHDLCFTYKFSNHRMQIIMAHPDQGTDAVVVADSIDLASGGANTKMTTNLKGYWRMVAGGPIGDTPVNTIYDLSPNGLNGVATNPVWIDIDNTLSLTGNNAYVSVATNTDGKLINNFTTAFTFSIWAKITAVQNGYAGLMSNINGRSDGNKILIRNNGADTEILWRGHNGTDPVDTLATKTGANLVNDGLWHHYVVTYDGANVKIFLDGVLLFTEAQTYTLGSGTTAMTLGWGSTTAGDYHLTGQIKDALLWNTGLTNQEVTDIYDQGNTLSYFPKWRADPPTEPPPPSPLINPFVGVYNVPLPATVAEQDFVRLHAITAASLTEHYNVGQGTQQTGEDVTEDGSYYSNDPAYSPGSTPETMSSYDIATAEAGNAINSYLKLDNLQYGGERFSAGSDVIGKTLSRIQVYMADVNNDNAPASGNITCQIVNSSGTLQQSSNSIDANTLIDNQGGANDFDWDLKEFTFTGTPRTIANGDRIQFKFDEGGTGGGGAGGGTSTADYNKVTTAPADFVQMSFNYLGAQFIDSGSPLIGKVITQIDVKMADAVLSGVQATHNITVEIIGAGSIRATSNAIAASSINNYPSYSTCTFTFPSNTYSMVSGDSIHFKYHFQTGSNDNSAVYTGIAQNLVASTHVAQFTTFGGYDHANNAWDTCMTITTTTTTGGGGGAAPGGATEILSGYSQLNTAPDANVAAFDFNTSVVQKLENISSDLHGKVITHIDIKLADLEGRILQLGGPTMGPASGNVTASIHRGDTHASVGGSSNSIAANTLVNYTGTNTFDIKTFTFSTNTHVMDGARGDYIRLNYNFGGSNNNTAVGTPAKAGNLEANSTLAFGTTSNTITTQTNFDILMDVYVSTGAGGGGGGTGAMQVGVARVVGNGSAAPCRANADQYDILYATPATVNFRTATHDIDMTVYIAGTSGTPSHIYNKLNVAAGQNRVAAIFINAAAAGLVGKQPTRITVRLRRAGAVGTPTGNLFCRIKKGSDGSTITFGLNGSTTTPQLDVSTLGTANNPATLYNFENDDNGQTGGYALQTGDRIIFELVGGTSDATNSYVEIAKTHTSSTIPNVYMQMSTDGTTWTPSTANADDVIGVVYVGGFITPNINPYHTLGFQNTRISQKVTSSQSSINNLLGKTLTQIKPWLFRLGSPTGLISVVIRDGAGALKASINTMQAADVSNVDFTQYTFTNLNNTYSMAPNDRVSVEYSGGDASNHIRINTNLLNTYPYGVLETFAGTTYTQQTNHDLAGSIFSGGGASDPLARTRVGEKVATTASALKLKKISRIKVRMKRTGSPSGNVTFLIRNAADAIAATIGTKPIMDVDPNTPVEYTITSNPISVYALQVGDRVSVEYNAGDDFNFVEVMTTKTLDGFDGVTNTYLEKHDGNNWVASNAIDLVGTMDEGGDTFTPSQEDVTIPDPVYTKDLCILAGGPPWSYINHVTSTLTHAPSQLFTNAVMPDFRFYRKVLTVAELTNIFTNRVDRGDIPYGQVAILGYFSLNET